MVGGEDIKQIREAGTAMTGGKGKPCERNRKRRWLAVNPNESASPTQTRPMSHLGKTDGSLGHSGCF